MIQEGCYHSFQTFHQLKKENNIGVALLFHAIYFSKPSDTQTKYTSIIELNTSLSSNRHKAVVYTL